MAKCSGEKEIKNKKRLRPPASFFTWFAENNEAFSDIVAEVCQSITRFFQEMMFFFVFIRTHDGHWTYFNEICIVSNLRLLSHTDFSHLVTAFKILDTHGVFSKFVLFLLSSMDGGKSGAVFLTAYGHSTSVSIQYC